MSRGNVEEELRRWAKNWLERFKPFTNFLRLLNIPPKPEVEEHYAKLFGDAIIEALLSDKALDCKLVAKFSEHGYVRCGNLYVQTRSSVREFTGDETEFKEFGRSATRMLQAYYWYPSIMDITVYKGEIIRADELAKVLGEVFITKVAVWLHSVIIDFRSPSNENVWGSLMFTISSSGKSSIRWAGVVESEDVRKKAMQDVLKHISELDKALESLYSVLKVGLKGVVGYVLY
jgi:hypothetical protein